MRSTFDNYRDQKAANEVIEDRSLMCSAMGCPNLWSIDLDGRLCTAHSQADREHWPAVTTRQLWLVTERARKNQEPKPHIEPLTKEDKLKILRDLQVAMANLKVGQ